MATLRILVPDASVNYIQNPSLRFDTTGWNLLGSTISRTLDYARFGIASLKVVTNGSALNEGAYYRVNALLGISEPITVSAYVRGTGIVRIRMINSGGDQRVSKPIALRSDRWKRIHVTGFSTGTNDLRLYVETAKSVAQAATFYVDGAQMERKSFPTTYIDGDQEGCRWSGLAHGSISSRTLYSREGGRWVNLASPEQEKEDLYLTVMNGFGVAPIRNVTNEFALLPGSYYQSTKISDRVIILNFHTKHKDIGRCRPNTLKYLHALRQELFDVIKPDKISSGKEFILEYQDGEFPIYVRARYEAGLEGDWDIRNRWFNSFPIRLLSVTPLLWEDDQEVAAIDYQNGVILNNVGARIDGAWSNLNFGFNGNVNDFEIGSRGEIIAAGSFTLANNNALALNPLLSAGRIAYWDGEKWATYGIGANGAINDIAVAPNGYVYVTGAFTSIGGVAAARVAFWDGAAWNAMGAGLNAEGYNIQVAPDGQVFVGGTFTTAGGVTANYIARWTGAAWYSLGVYNGLNNFVHSIAISLDGSLLYAGGAFTDQNTNPGSGLTRVATYNLLTGIWSSMGNGLNATVREVIISPTGTIFAAGEFTLTGTETVNYIAQWNGSTWISLGAGLNSIVNSMSISKSGDLVVVGQFTQAGSVQVKKVALWNGSTWVNLDIDIGVGLSTVEIYAVEFLPNGDLYLGGTLFSNSTNSSLFSGITLVQNTGTAEVSPNLYIQGPATIRRIENQTTQKRMFMSLAILSGEEVFIDFARVSIQSNIRGNLSFSILPGSDFRSFTLLPGENRIAAFMENDVAAGMYMSYVPRHWSADATAQREDF